MYKYIPGFHHWLKQKRCRWWIRKELDLQLRFLQLQKAA